MTTKHIGGLPSAWEVWQFGIVKNPVFAYNNGLAKTALGGIYLGSLLSFSIMSVIFLPSLRQFCLYLIVIAIFHLLEFFMTAIFKPGDLSFTSFLLTHSKEFYIANLAAVVEYWIEFFIFPSLKLRTSLVVAGFLLTAGGQIFRTLAMWQAASNFAHIVSTNKKLEHKLVTRGIYGIFRHPAYAGWFWWAVGTQLLLCNPICLLGYIYVPWRFFKSRIRYEEKKLFAFFGQEYVEYHKKVGSGIPGVTTPSLNPTKLQEAADEDDDDDCAF